MRGPLPHSQPRCWQSGSRARRGAPRRSRSRRASTTSRLRRTVAPRPQAVRRLPRGALPRRPVGRAVRQAVASCGARRHDAGMWAARVDGAPTAAQARGLLRARRGVSAGLLTWY
eukprot:scaffold19818_cov63-Phaeocystis_antarctica.AAC.5